MPVGIAAKAATFEQTCYPEGVPTPCDIMYLYLVWRDIDSDEIYTSVLQSAEPGHERLTRSQPAFYRAAPRTGVSWTRGLAPGDNIQGLFTDAALSFPSVFQGYGRY